MVSLVIHVLIASSGLPRGFFQTIALFGTFNTRRAIIGETMADIRTKPGWYYIYPSTWFYVDFRHVSKARHWY